MSEDVWEDELLDGRFGDVELNITSTEDVGGRELVRHKYPHRDGAKIEDVGGEQRTTHCEIIFFGPGHRQAFAAFYVLANGIDPQTFVHPVLGSYTAKVSNLHWQARAEPRACIQVDCVFEEDISTPAVFDIGPGSPAFAGSDAVDSAGDDFADALAAQGLSDETGLAAAASAVAHAWDETQKTIRDVTHELTAITDRIESEYTRLEVATDVSRYPIMTALLGLGSSLRKAASAFAARSPRIFEFTVEVTAPLLIVAATIYQDASQAADRATQLEELNDIKNPARIERGTVLSALSPGGARRQLRSPL